MTEQNAIFGMALALGVAQVKIPFHAQGPMQSELHTVHARRVGKTGVCIALAASAYVTEFWADPPDPNSVRTRTTRYDEQECANLIIEVPSIRRKYVLVVLQSAMQELDALLASHRDDDRVTLEITTKCVLLDADREPTQHYYASTLCWPIRSLKFDWCEIQVPQEQTSLT